jgi:hypothetical protein
MATVGTRHGQRATDHPQTCHFAASTVTTLRVDSLKQKMPRLTVHHRPTIPVQRHLATQHVQSVHAVPIPVRLDPAYPRSSRTSTRHGDIDALPPPPCIVVHRSDRAEPESDRVPTEPARVSTESRSHRRN